MPDGETRVLLWHTYHLLKQANTLCVTDRQADGQMTGKRSLFVSRLTHEKRSKTLMSCRENVKIKHCHDIFHCWYFSFSYLPEVFNTSNCSECSTARVGRVQKQVTHHLGVVIHCSSSHSKCDWKTKNLMLISKCFCTIYVVCIFLSNKNYLLTHVISFKETFWKSVAVHRWRLF